MTELPQPWPATLGADSPVRSRLLQAYDGPGRGYHDRTHLREVLDRVTLLLGTLPPGTTVIPDAVVLAAWFHDAVYEGRPDDEERSAVLAERELATAGLGAVLTDEVARLVRVTAHHRPADDDLAGQVLCDADLAILAAPAPRYREYVAGVREEYRHVPEADFRRGRAAVLRDLLAKPTLFHTGHAREQWEARARANVAEELAALEADPGEGRVKSPVT